MKEIPILFSTPMVQAELDGRKTNTRRLKNLKVINENPDKWSFQEKFTHVGKYERDKHVYRFVDGEGSFMDILCPYGRPGDLLWVRETWAPAWNQVLYKANERYGKYEGQKWKPSIHMPKKAARIWLQVEGVRVERLQDISEEDAIAEGIEKKPGSTSSTKFDYRHYEYEGSYNVDAKVSFRTLWEKINGADSWAANPFAWVVKFNVLSTTGKPDLKSIKAV